MKQQQQHQKQINEKTRCRSLSSARSSTSSVSSVTVSSHHHYNRNRQQQNSIAISHNSKSKRRHQSAVYIKHIPQINHQDNLVNMKSFKKNEDQDQLARNLEQSQREIENLRRLLTERNDLIEKQKIEHDFQQKELVKLNESKLNDLKYNDQLMKQLEEQKDLILGLKTKLNKLKTEGNLDSDTMSCISNDLNKVRENVKQNFKNLDENKSKRKLSIDASVQATNDANNNEPSAKTQAEDLIETSCLVCNIPEHHKLEDLLHENKEYINKLKSQLKSENANLDEMALLEKKAEFEALDLAINTRKQQLYNLEMKKNKLSELNQTSSCSSASESNQSLIKVI